MKKFRCTICGYVHEGDNAPEKCPQCLQSGDIFEEIIEPGTQEDTAAPAIFFIAY